MSSEPELAERILRALNKDYPQAASLTDLLGSLDGGTSVAKERWMQTVRGLYEDRFVDCKYQEEGDVWSDIGRISLTTSGRNTAQETARLEELGDLLFQRSSKHVYDDLTGVGIANLREQFSVKGLAHSSSFVRAVSDAVFERLASLRAAFLQSYVEPAQKTELGIAPFREAWLTQKWHQVWDQEILRAQGLASSLAQSTGYSASVVSPMIGDVAVRGRQLTFDFLHDLKIAVVSQSHGTAVPSTTQAAEADDRKFARMAIEEARKSISENDGRAHPRVGAVVVKDGRVLSRARRGEQPGNHAEFVALEKKLPDEAVTGSTVYTTLEPCTTRNHPKVPCAARLIERRVARVVMGMLDPDVRITGRGQRRLRSAGIATDFFPPDLMAEAEELNREFTRFCEQNVRTEVGPANMELWKEVAGLRAEFADFKQSVETREKDREEFENLAVSFEFGQGSPGNCSGAFQNDSRHKVSIEAIRILRGDADHESPLTEAVKPRKTDDWTFEPAEGRTIFWGPQHDPISMLKSLVQSPDPNFPNGKVIAIAFELNLKVEGKRLSKKFVRQVLMQGNQILTWGP